MGSLTASLTCWRIRDTITLEPTNTSSVAKPSPSAWAAEEMEKGLLSPEDRDSVVVTEYPPHDEDDLKFTIHPTPSYRTPPRVSRRSIRYDDDEDDDDASLRKSLSFTCESPESEAALFRKLQEISGVGPPPPRPRKKKGSCHPEQLSPGETVALVRQVLRVSLPLLPTKSDEQKVRHSSDSVTYVSKSLGFGLAEGTEKCALALTEHPHASAPSENHRYPLA